jgi:hypothetical protein
MPAPTTTALPIVEDAVLAALNALAPAGAASWGAAPINTQGNLKRPTSDPEHLSRVYVAQHQDGGGRPAPLLGSEGWEGLVVVRVLSGDRARARAGYDLAVTAMAGLVSPAGYHIGVRFDRPIALPVVDRIYAYAGQWRLTVRRVAL